MEHIFYHLSLEDDLQCISNESPRPEKEVTPRTPIHCYDEPDTPRVCVAPKVEQCLISIGLERWDVDLHIYRLKVNKFTTPPDGVLDTSSTDERWILPEDIDDHSGRIELEKIGCVNRNRNTHVRLSGILHKQNPKWIQIYNDMDGDCWDISESKVWTLKDDILLA